MISGDVEVTDGINALVDRTSGRFTPDEGNLLDYKEVFGEDRLESGGELARDILGFSNTEGGILICGVADGSQAVVGHKPINFRTARETLGLFLGTRVNFDMDECQVSVQGNNRNVVVINVPRAATVYPNLLRKDINLKPGLVRKLKY